LHGNGSFQVSGNAGPNGTVTVTAPNANGSPKLVQVNISTVSAGKPFGSFDTPIDNTAGVEGAIPVTGWALDNVEVMKSLGFDRFMVAVDTSTPASLTVRGLPRSNQVRPGGRALRKR